MGMRKREIDAKFDQIVAFSEVEKFLDTPLKFYSTGMMVRLGFAVAAHINPDILLVDEVLAVGDTAFQAKCLNKIAELKEQEKTIVLVSHTMPSILQHSSRVLWIDHGTVQAFGDPDETVERYLRTVHAHGASTAAQDQRATTDSPIHVTNVTVRNARGESHECLDYGEPATVEIDYVVTRPVDDPVVSVTFHDARDFPLGGLTSRLDGIRLDGTQGGGKVRLDAVAGPVHARQLRHYRRDPRQPHPALPRHAAPGSHVHGRRPQRRIARDQRALRVSASMGGRAARARRVRASHRSMSGIVAGTDSSAVEGADRRRRNSRARFVFASFRRTTRR